MADCHLHEIQLCIKHILKSIEVHDVQNKTFHASLIVALYNRTLLKKTEKKKNFFIVQIYIYEFTDYAMSIF